MRFQAAVALGLFTAAFAAPIENTKFDLPAITSTFNNIQGGIDKMVGDVKNYKGTESMPAMLASSQGILDALKEGTAAIAKSPALGLMDAIGILGPVGTLSSKVDEIILALAEKKEILKGLGVSSVVKDELVKQKAGADDLVKAITNNLPMPALLGIVAGPIAKQITDKLEGGIKQWS
jgi:Hydrophobic surface binding protein A